VDLPGIRPPGRTSHDVELAKQAADHLVGILGGTEVIELLENFSESPFDVVHGRFGEMLSLLFEALLTLDELLPVKRGPGRGLGLPDGKRVSEEAGDAMP
jgi:hypothetical protein